MVNIADWHYTLRHQIEEQKKFWHKKNLRKHGTMGREWTAGYTITLDQFSYDIFFDEWLDLDVDENGLSFGQAFTYDLRGRRSFRRGLVRLVRYEPNFGGEKGLSESGQVVMEFQIVHRAGI